MPSGSRPLSGFNQLQLDAAIRADMDYNSSSRPLSGFNQLQLDIEKEKEMGEDSSRPLSGFNQLQLEEVGFASTMVVNAFSSPLGV